MNAQRNPDRTRTELLEAAFNEVHRSGFRSASLDAILSGAGVTKGALYHHFPSKMALGYALIDEVLRGMMRTVWLDPIQGKDDPITAMIAQLTALATDTPDEVARLGCPLNNLIQEMAAVDEGFRLRLETVAQEWIDGIAQAIRHGKERGTVRADVNDSAAASFIVTACEGASGLMKISPQHHRLTNALTGLTDYLQTLRPQNKTGEM